MHKLKADGLYKKIKKTDIIQDISLELRSKEIVGLLGPNGAGKSTTFYIMTGILQADKGEIYFDNHKITDLSLHQRANIGIGYLPQESTIFKDLSVEENLQIAAEICIPDESKRRKKIENLLEIFNIEPIRHRKGINLSGGERRRAEIARALVKEPRFLLLDEPFAGVDPLAIIDIQKIIAKLSELGIGILITDHNVREMLNICDRAYVIKDGMLLASGSSEDVYKNDQVRKHYLGENFKL